MLKVAWYNYRQRGRLFPTPLFVFELHDGILEEHGGPPGFTDWGQVNSALAAPIRAFDLQETYPTFFSKVAALGYLITQNHGFSDANKRVTLLTMETTLVWNGEYPGWSQETKVMMMKLLSAGYLTIDGLRFALLAACGYDVDQYHDLHHH